MRNVTIPDEAYPLAWPAGRKRTLGPQRERARFGRLETQTRSYGDGQSHSWRQKREITVAGARDQVLAELERLGARGPWVISTNVPTRLDGQPRSGVREPDDPGVAVYFKLNSVETCIALDRYDRVADNLRAVAKSIEAMRGIERWGGAQLVAAAFQGFQGLPAPGETSDGAESWWSVLEVPPDAPLALVEATARAKLAASHPDRGGDAARFHRVKTALDAARRERA